MRRGNTVPDAFAEFSGSQLSYQFSEPLLNPSAVPIVQQGSYYGTPPQMSIAGQTGDTTSTRSGVALASDVITRSPGSHPILWLVILMVIGVLGLGWVAHLEVRRR